MSRNRYQETIKELLPILYDIAVEANPDHATFDQLAEEVIELHLALRGKYDKDAPELELLEIATIAINMLAKCELWSVLSCTDDWYKRHGGKA